MLGRAGGPRPVGASSGARLAFETGTRRGPLQGLVRPFVPGLLARRREGGPEGDPARGPPARGRALGRALFRNLVDPASSHMLVSKAKPCTCKHRPPHGEAANGSLDRLQFIRSYTVTWITVVILELIHATNAPTCLAAGRGEFIRSKPTGLRGPSPLVTQDNFGLIARPWRRRRIFQVSALSSSVCRCSAYIAGDG